ncbi:MAG: SDR family oxidoreductase [Cyclobacteriaceae bacterium]|nr:SDR family oxidoreductase [Cyclobacteriaceae bacterium]
MGKEKSKNILITGVSTGIGYGVAKELIGRGYTIFGSVRKMEDGNRLQQELGSNFKPLQFDVTDQEAIDRSAKELTFLLQGQGLGAAINNAGVSMSGPLEHLPMEDFIYNFDVNVFGLLRVTKAFLPLLGVQPNHPSSPGRILNISSVAGKMAAPFLGAYSGSKHAVEALSHTMRREFQRYGIEVVIIAPGPVQTPIWDKGSMERFEKTLYIKSLINFFTWFTKEGKRGITLESFSKQLADILEKDKPALRYALVKDKFKNWTVPRLLGDRAMDDFFKKML